MLEDSNGVEAIGDICRLATTVDTNQRRDNGPQPTVSQKVTGVSTDNDCLSREVYRPSARPAD